MNPQNLEVIRGLVKLLIFEENQRWKIKEAILEVS